MDQKAGNSSDISVASVVQINSVLVFVHIDIWVTLKQDVVERGAKGVALARYLEHRQNLQCWYQNRAQG